MKKLIIYLNKKNITAIEFAAMLDVNVRNVYRYLNGTRTPSKATMCKINHITSGEIQPNDFFDLTNL